MFGRCACRDHSTSPTDLNFALGAYSQGLISNILEEEVVQPLLVSTSAIELSTETVALLLKVDDYHLTR